MRFYKFIDLDLKSEKKFLFSNFGCKKCNLMKGKYFSSLFKVIYLDTLFECFYHQKK